MTVKDTKYTKRYSDNLWVEFDPDDPHTPVMVYYKSRKHGLESATYHCAIEVGEVEGHTLTKPQYNWLDKMEAEAGDFYDKYRDVEA